MNKDMADMIRLHESTRAPMIICQRLLEEHGFDEAKRVILELYSEITERGCWTWDIEELASLPEWKSTLINGKKRRLRF